MDNISVNVIAFRLYVRSFAGSNNLKGYTPADFLRGMPLVQQDVDVVVRIHHTVLVQRHGAPGQTHSGQAKILRDYYIALLHEIYQRKVHAVGPLGDRNGARALFAELMRSIAKDQAFQSVLTRKPHGDVYHRAAVGVNE